MLSSALEDEQFLHFD